MSFIGGSGVKNLPAVQETWVRSLGQEDSLQEGMATNSSILSWRIPWTEEPGRHRESDMTERLSTYVRGSHASYTDSFQLTFPRT